jgi:acyl carrier protein phosphodiesterase
MNYLAHLYLSGKNKELLVGNFIADDVKGKRYLSYSSGIQKGILLHRKIDHFSDNHPVFNESKKRLYPVYSHYARVVNDIFYDHFLAKNWETFSDVPLSSFSSFCYRTLLSYWFHLPANVKRYLPFVVLHRRLTAYAEIEGLRNSLEIMSRHSSLPDYTDQAIDILICNYDVYEAEFYRFFPEIIEYCDNLF